MASPGQDSSGQPPDPPAEMEVTPVKIAPLANTAPLGRVGGEIQEPPLRVTWREWDPPPAH